MIDFDISSLSAENTVAAQVLQLRAQIANGQAEQVLAKVQKGGKEPDLVAVKAFALYGTGKTADAVQEFENIISSSSDNATVQVLGGIVLQAEGRTDEALALLTKHQGSLEAYCHHNYHT